MTLSIKFMKEVIITMVKKKLRRAQYLSKHSVLYNIIYSTEAVTMYVFIASIACVTVLLVGGGTMVGAVMTHRLVFGKADWIQCACCIGAPAFFNGWALGLLYEHNYLPWNHQITGMIAAVIMFFVFPNWGVCGMIYSLIIPFTIRIIYWWWEV